MPTPAKPTNLPVAPRQQPLPIQRYQVTEKDFKDPKLFNVFLSQLVGAVQSVQGAGGPSVLPSGIDVQGSTVSGLGPPQSETDAISSGHAQSQFSPEAIAPKLDVGGANALTGLTNIYLLMQQAGSGTVTLAKLTGGGTNGSITFKQGLMQSFVQPT